MLSIQIKAPSEAPKALIDLVKFARDKRSLMGEVGATFENVLQEHFDAKNRQPNKRGFKKSNFYARISRRTHLTKYDDSSATVTVSDPAFAAKVYGATIRPTGGRKAIAIPLTEATYGKRPSQLNWRAKLKLIPGKPGKPSLLALQDGEKIIPQFVLLKSVSTPADPTALPESSDVNEALHAAIADFLDREFMR